MAQPFEVSSAYSQSSDEASTASIDTRQANWEKSRFSYNSFLSTWLTMLSLTAVFWQYYILTQQRGDVLTGDTNSGTRRIGILGGMSAASTVPYYQHITDMYVQRFGKHAYPEIVLFSVSFQQYIDWVHSDDWDSIVDGLSAGLHILDKAGADFVIIAANTPHKVIDRLQENSPLQILSILDVVADEVAASGLSKVAILGTRFTMEGGFYEHALEARGVHSITPNVEQRNALNTLIFSELISNTITENGKRICLDIIKSMEQNGAEGLILGCTELPLIISGNLTRLPLFDTTLLHATAALNKAIQQ